MNASQQAKQRGARCYATKDFVGAVQCFTEAIERADGNDMDLHLYHSNRCAAYQQLRRWAEALDDAEATTQIKPTWAKGWSRFAACLERDPRRRGEAAAAYARAQELDGVPRTTRARDNSDSGGGALARILIDAKIWYESLDPLNKAGVWAAALFALYFCSILLGGSSRRGGYTTRPRSNAAYEREYDDTHYVRRRAPSSYGGGGGQGLGTAGLGELMLAAWKLPPYFGHQPFMGMGPMQFMWLVQMFTGQRRGGYGGLGRGLGRGFGRRRGFF